MKQQLCLLSLVNLTIWSLLLILLKEEILQGLKTLRNTRKLSSLLQNLHRESFELLTRLQSFSTHFFQH
ncbi:hypothetical protein IFM89_001913, partial [Coptis chinensis]